jgi:hypothetical protein
LLIVFTELVSSEFHSNFQIKQQKMLWQCTDFIEEENLRHRKRELLLRTD